MMLDFRLETFLELCRIGNYTKTAEYLHITQPAVTQHIKYLEDQYGGKLFIYKDKRLTLTERGNSLYYFALTMRADSNRIKSLLSAKETSPHHIAFGATLTVGEYVMAPIVGKIWESYPSLPITMLVDNTQVLLQKLHDGIIDFALLEGFFDKDRYSSKIISDEEFIGVCSPISELAERQCCFDEILDYRLILREKGSGTRDIFEQALRAHNLTVESFIRVSEIGNMSAIKQLVSNNLGISFMYRAAANKELSQRMLVPLNIKDFSARHAFSFVFLKDSLHHKEYWNWYEFFKKNLFS